MPADNRPRPASSSPPWSNDQASEGPSDGTTTTDLGAQHAAVQPVPPAVGAWGALTLLEEIGRGGFGRVYRAHDPALGRDVALKLVEVVAPTAEAVSLVLGEGQRLARVRHPNVVTVFGAQQLGNTIGIWMELVRGRTLSDLVRKDGPFGAEEATLVCATVCRALAAVHAAGLVHRDVKAQNVMREAGGRIILMDFGTGWDPNTVSGAGSRVVGTPVYMAPEIVGGSHPSSVSDIYSVGVLLFFLVTGRYPVDGHSIGDVALAYGLGHRTAVTDLRPDLPEGFVRVLERALAAAPAERYQTAGAMLRDLTHVLPMTLASPEVGREREWSATFYAGAPSVDTGSLPTPTYGAEPAALDRPGAWVRSSRRPVVRGVLLAGTVLVAVGGIGMLTSVSFDNTLGRPWAFSRESLLSWWVWGVRTLVAPLAYMTVMGLLLLAARSLYRLVRGIAAGRRVDDRPATGPSSFPVFLGLRDPVLAAQAALALQVLVVGALIWRFGGLFSAATTFVSTARREQLAVLSTANLGEHILFGLVLDLSILAMVIVWMRILTRRAEHHVSMDRGPVAAGFALIGLLFLMWAMPYRVIWHNRFERVDVGTERCYEIGSTRDTLLLHCPDRDPPRNQTVSRADVRLRRTGIEESIFTPPAGRGR